MITDALSDRLSTDLWNDWSALRFAVAAELDVTEDEVEALKSDHYRHLLELSFYAIQQN